MILTCFLKVTIKNIRIKQAHNKSLMLPLRGWNGLHAASLCFSRPKVKRYVSEQLLDEGNARKA